MTNSDKDFIVAIELGSSKISGIAGKKKDGTMQVLAYAEEKTAGCIKRGVVYNIEKTYQSINTIIQKLEAVLKTKITRAYIGLGGQSMRSYKCVIKRNLLTQSYITNIRMQKARHLLDTHLELSVLEVALQCGYDDQSSFTRAFKRFFGITPSEYQQRSN